MAASGRSQSTPRVSELQRTRVYVAYDQNSVVGKILEIDQETRGRIHVTLIRQVVSY